MRRHAPFCVLAVVALGMHWVYLFAASACEIGWMLSMNAQPFQKVGALAPDRLLGDPAEWLKLLPLLGYIVFGVANVWLLGKALTALPMAVAFSIWYGTALVGVTVLERVLHDVKLVPMQMLFMALIVVGVVGLKQVSRS